MLFIKYLLGYALILILSGARVTSKVHELQDADHEQIFQGSWLVMFYAPWCPACQGLKAPWADLAAKERTDGLQIAQIDVSKYPALSGQFLIFNLPTIYYIDDGACHEYYGSKEMSAIASWLDEEKWKSVEPIPYWRAPDSIMLKSIGKFFKFSNDIRGLKKSMEEEYAMPSMLIYAIFLLITVILGLIAGLFLVCLCDCFFPPRPLETVELTPGEAEDDQGAAAEENKDKKEGEKGKKKKKGKGVGDASDKKQTDSDSKETKQVRKRIVNK